MDFFNNTTFNSTGYNSTDSPPVYDGFEGKPGNSTYFDEQEYDYGYDYLPTPYPQMEYDYSFDYYGYYN